MKREGESDAGKLAEVLARASGLPLAEMTELVGRTTGEGFQRPTPATPELGPKARAAIAAAHEFRMAARGEEARAAEAGERRRIAPRRNPSPAVPERTARRREFEAQLRAAGSSLELEDFDSATYAMAARVQRRGARGALEVLASLPPELARIARYAALLEAREDGEPRTWRSWAARRTLVYVTALYRMSRRVRRKPGYATVVVGVTVGMLGALVKNPATGEAYSKAAMVGMLRDGRDPAPLRALKEAGAWIRVQPPAHEVPARLRGRDAAGEERAVGQFWFLEKVVAEYVPEGGPRRRRAAVRRSSSSPGRARPPD